MQFRMKIKVPLGTRVTVRLVVTRQEVIAPREILAARAADAWLRERFALWSGGRTRSDDGRDPVGRTTD